MSVIIEHDEVFKKRINKHKAYLVEPLEEVCFLLGGDKKKIANFEAILYVTFIFYRPDKLKLEQEELRKAKVLKEKISIKALELSKLLKEAGDCELPIDNSFPSIFSLDLIQEAGKRIYAKGETKELHINEAKDFKKIISPAIKRLSKNFEAYYSCPDISEVIFELHKELDSTEFKTPEIRQPTARSMTVKFYLHLIEWACNGMLSKPILDISLKTVACFINVILDLEGDELMSEEVAGKAISKAIEQDNRSHRNEQDN